MIETEEQRRWWFATHPEYSWSHRGTRQRSGNETRSEKEKNEDKVDPRDVDRYVDRSLKYETDELAAYLLRSVKQIFGTEADLLEQWQKVLKAWEAGGEEVRASFAQYLYDDGRLLRLPTLEQLSRWPTEVARQFLRWLNALWEANYILSDPNAPENHHRLVKELTKYFMDCGLEVDMYLRIMKASDHRRLHMGKGRGGDWNREWREFAHEYPAENTDEQRQRIREKLEDMEERYGVADKGFKWPPNPEIPL